MPEVPLEGAAEHRQAVRGFALRLVGDAALADDLAQETFLRAQRSSSGHRGEASLRSWLFAASDSGAPEKLACGGEDAEQSLLQREMSTCIGEFLFRLPHPQCDVVALHDTAGLAHHEIALLLDISVANSRVLLHRGRAALREILKENCVLSFDGDDVPCERRPPAAGEG
jgi:RNA polymerase sigma-70 factor (ECF subfamily)